MSLCFARANPNLNGVPNIKMGFVLDAETYDKSCLTVGCCPYIDMFPFLSFIFSFYLFMKSGGGAARVGCGWRRGGSGCDDGCRRGTRDQLPLPAARPTAGGMPAKTSRVCVL